MFTGTPSITPPEIQTNKLQAAKSAIVIESPTKKPVSPLSASSFSRKSSQRGKIVFVNSPRISTLNFGSFSLIAGLI